MTLLRTPSNTSLCTSGGRRVRRGCSERGFTLIELLVSLVILSTGIVVVLEAFQTSLLALAESRDALISDALARERLALVDLDLLTSPGNIPRSSLGSFDGDYDEFNWSVMVSSAPFPTSGNDDDGATYIVEVTVWRDESARQRSISTAFRVGGGEGK
ncbi:MAG: type II secretion system protein [Kiritimatiellia bacterium]|jgi:prepilin-type N-terminal cleavage/methylation domain-containing protein|nr:type II secretion system protein [Kiritimatiellia bacterium]